MPNAPEDDVIRQIAYRLWEEAGRPNGRAHEFWHQAVIRHARKADLDTLPAVKPRQRNGREEGGRRA